MTQRKDQQGTVVVPVLVFNAVVGGLGGLYASTGSFVVVALIGAIAIAVLVVARWWGGS